MAHDVKKSKNVAIDHTRGRFLGLPGVHPRVPYRTIGVYLPTLEVLYPTLGIPLPILG